MGLSETRRWVLLVLTQELTGGSSDELVRTALIRAVLCERIAEKAGLNLNIYWAFVEGFLKETAPTLTEAEAETLGNSCFTLACELSTRFLDDYITGDKYFKIKDPKHNLTRTRCQIALAKDMRRKMDAMNAIVRDGWKRYRDQ